MVPKMRFGVSFILLAVLIFGFVGSSGFYVEVYATDNNQILVEIDNLRARLDGDIDSTITDILAQVEENRDFGPFALEEILFEIDRVRGKLDGEPSTVTDILAVVEENRDGIARLEAKLDKILLLLSDDDDDDDDD